VDLTVVIPVHNEAGSIASLLDELYALPGELARCPVIVVDDASSDDTAAVLQDCLHEHALLRVLRHRQRYGQSAAIATGVRAANTLWIATLDGDGQNDPRDIPRLYQAMDSASDTVWLVNGNRKQRRDNWRKRLASRIANAVRARILGDAAPDSGCGLKVFSRATFLALPQFDHMHRFLPALVYRQGGEVMSIDVNHRARRSGKSKYGIRNRLGVGIMDLLGVRWLQHRKLQPVATELDH
jgi:dolichol-phosphate mannosyltransferase